MDAIAPVAEASVLEYGSHVGVNFRVLRDLYPDKMMRCFAVEPNDKAYTFMMDKLPFIEGLKGEDTTFIAAPDYPPCPVTVSFTSGVLVVMEATPAHVVLAKLAAISTVVILGEQLDNLESRKSDYNLAPAYHKHPYRMWLRDLGFEITQVVPAPNPQPQFTGFVVAKRAT